MVGAAAALLVACAGSSESAPATNASDGSIPSVTDPATDPTAAAPTVEAADATTTTSAPVTDATTKPVRTRVEGVDPVRPDGFSTVTVRVTSAAGDVCEVCMWLADAPEERARGLMGVTDLGDAVGMAFVWERETSSRFHMTGTPTPLSIAWFDSSGGHVSELDMDPCLEVQTAECERYWAAGAYTLAIEMFQGELDAIGIGPGSSVAIVSGTESAGCVAV